MDTECTAMDSENNNITAVTEFSLAEEPSIKRRRTQVQKQHMEISSNVFTESTEFFSSQSTEYSQGTETEYCISSQASSASSYVKTSRIESLNNFLSVCGVSPVKELRNTLTESSDRTKQRYTSKARQCIDILLDTICPDEGDSVWKFLINQQQEEETSQHTTILKEIYLNADTWQFRRQILSILTQQMTFDEAQNLIPDLTSWRYYEAKKHAAEIGVGLTVPSKSLPRERISNESLEHFIDFITSSHIIKDIPFGQRTLKMGSGEIVQIPNVVRSLTSTTLINQYLQLCQEEDVSPLGKSTLFKILSDCPASVRKSIEGLDNYVMEGSRAFQTLEEILDLVKEDEMKAKLTEVKRYLKTDFKVHLDLNTCVQDHCLVYALSLPQKEFKSACNHQHTQRCCDCLDIDDILEKNKDFYRKQRNGQ